MNTPKKKLIIKILKVADRILTGLERERERQRVDFVCERLFGF